MRIRIAASSALVLGFLLLAVLLIINYKPARTAGSRSQDGASARRESRASNAIPVTPGIDESQKAPGAGSERRPELLLEKWLDVPIEFAAFQIPISDRSDGRNRLRYIELLTRLSWEATEYGFSSEEIDRQRRAIGIVQTIDYLLFELSGVPLIDGLGGGGGNEYYFPTGSYRRPMLPEDPKTVRDKLLRLVAEGGTADLVRKLPAQHRAIGIEEGVATRALLLAASLGPDPSVRGMLQGKLTEERASLHQKAAAAVGLLLQGNDHDVLNWLVTQDWQTSMSAVRGLLPNERTFQTIGGNTTGTYAASLGRGLDSHLLGLLGQAPDLESKAILAQALSGRVDNPAVRSAVLGLMHEGDPTVQVALLRNRPALLDDPVYQLTLKNLVQSPDMRVSSYALIQLSMVPDLWVRDIVAAQLSHEDPRKAWQAAQGLAYCGRAEPLGTIELIRKQMQARNHDSTFQDHARTSIHQLTRMAQDQGLAPTPRKRQ